MPVTIYRNTDRIKVKIGELVFMLAPLSFEQKSEISALSSKIEQGELVTNGMLVYYKSIQFSLKDIEGLVDSDGNKYELQFNERGITTECMDELFNMEFSHQLMVSAYNMVAQIPTKIIDPATGQEMEGVEIVKGK